MIKTKPTKTHTAFLVFTRLVKLQLGFPSVEGVSRRWLWKAPHVAQATLFLLFFPLLFFSFLFFFFLHPPHPSAFSFRMNQFKRGTY
ncbi:hypothetical protein IE53DRAFT_30629 [Violaceomyces palustris]|uniref:Uncharacterized protein n=1 Tax=Violaceomyces palustris TaxID=1673888 RepID=A0ACD0NL17_9BASI|nr:hypothetical protein IE53DRAFT_30629 [Violaceomyces palustris]